MQRLADAATRLHSLLHVPNRFIDQLDGLSTDPQAADYGECLRTGASLIRAASSAMGVISRPRSQAARSHRRLHAVEGTQTL
jgi:hypothetical protein